jgi:hypothetical protein
MMPVNNGRNLITVSVSIDPIPTIASVCVPPVLICAHLSLRVKINAFNPSLLRDNFLYSSSKWESKVSSPGFHFLRDSRNSCSMIL